MSAQARHRELQAHALRVALEGFTESFNKELPQAWNIKAVIIEPGGFATELNQSSMVHTPPHPAYASADSPANVFRVAIKAAEMIGDPERAAQALIKIAGIPNPPLRVQLGTDALMGVRKKSKKTVSDSDKWEALSHSTNQEGVEKVALARMISLQSQD